MTLGRICAPLRSASCRKCLAAIASPSKKVELWVCHTAHFDIDDVDYFRTKGVTTWFYGPMIYDQKKNGGCGSNTFLDLDLLLNRGIGRVGWKYRSGWVVGI
jgi:hypothetical protein